MAATAHPFVAAFLTLLPMAGCSGAVVSVSNDGGGTPDGSGSPDASADTSTDASGGVCPTSEPADGSACTPNGFLRCEYGSDPHCTTIAECSGPGPNGPFTWHLTPPDPSCAGNPPQCPATYGTPANGAACPYQGTCSYPDGRCECVVCTGDGGQGHEWACDTYRMPAGCPEPRPALGTACTQEGQDCAYGPACCAIVDVGPDMVCRNGVWTTVPIGCDCAANLCGK
jgi:hypothetical protein